MVNRARAFPSPEPLCFVIFPLNSLISFQLPRLPKDVSHLMGDIGHKRRGHQFACRPFLVCSVGLICEPGVLREPQSVSIKIKAT